VAQRERTDRDVIKVINNGIALPPDYIEMPEIFQRVKADLWIGITANLKPVKRIDVFLKGLSILKERSKVDFHAIVLGEGAEEMPLKMMVRDLGLSGIVHFMGSVDNVYAYLKNLHIGVLCSDREGFSNAIMEYMACGLPVVATDVGGNTELVDEENGMVVPAGNGEALGRALMILAEQPELRKVKGLASLERIKERYAWDRIIMEWESYYQSLLR
jgi:glycosyltransferase involved in cell wall biosynthesis